ncbi:MAG TPA: GGDEF domain-containing protein [Novosphingobium sp.]|nr:GGDEF domain-containing protein [Novosphingobium sp.]
MSEKTTHAPRTQRGVLRWLGFGKDEPFSPEGEGISIHSDSPGIDEARERRRRQLIEDIGSFLLIHRLEVSGSTLAIAHDVITGTNTKLAAIVEQQVSARKPVTVEWLEENARKCGSVDNSHFLNTLMEKLETSVEDFGQTATAARTATNEYNSALEAQVGELERVNQAGEVINELARIAQIMLDRTRQIEQEMNRSETETRALKVNLETARREAEMDHLTGLPNRRAFETLLEREQVHATRNNEALSVVFCDIDHFKRINDTHGHEAGDRVLRAVAKSLSKISNDRCHVARHGGEEFVMLLRGKALAEAFAIVDAAREEMAERRMVNRATDIPFGRITFSAGIADVFAYPNPREALKAADEALYAAKNQGRDQIVLASDLEQQNAA